SEAPPCPHLRLSLPVLEFRVAACRGTLARRCLRLHETLPSFFAAAATAWNGGPRGQNPASLVWIQPSIGRTAHSDYPNGSPALEGCAYAERLRGREVAANKRFHRILGPILEALRR